jgi:hypothetical protein
MISSQFNIALPNASIGFCVQIDFCGSCSAIRVSRFANCMMVMRARPQQFKRQTSRAEAIGYSDVVEVYEQNEKSTEQQERMLMLLAG